MQLLVRVSPLVPALVLERSDLRDRGEVLALSLSGRGTHWPRPTTKATINMLAKSRRSIGIAVHDFMHVEEVLGL